MAASETPRQWLTRTARRGAHWSRLSILAGTGSTLVLLVQAWCIATVAQRMTIDGAVFTSVLVPLVILPFAFVARGALTRARTIAGARAGIEIRQSVRRELLERLAALGPIRVRRQHSATLGNRIWDQVDALQGYYADYRPQMMLCAITPAIIVLAVFPLSWAAGLILLVTGPLIPLNMAMVGLGAKKRQEDQFREMTRMSRHFLDTLRGLSTLRLFNRGKAHAERVHASSENFRRRTMRVLRLAFLSSTVLEFFASVSIALLALYIGFVYLGQFDFGVYGGGLSLFAGLFMLVLAPEYYQPLRDLGTLYHSKAEAEAAAEDLLGLLHQPVAEREGQVPWRASGAVGLRLSGVTARYAGRHEPALKGLELDIRGGETLAVIGPSGAGKSSLLNVLMGFMVLKAGEVTVDDGADPRALGAIDAGDWQRELAWVGQSAVILSGSLGDNLRLAAPDADDNALHDALQQAALGDWLSRLPAGLDTPLGEGGRAVSGGEARRIALARAFLRDARVVLLDEPTASLDSESEALVLQALQRLRHGRTLVVLTHRLELLALADRVLLLEGGERRALDSPAALREAGILRAAARDVIEEAR
ncbi:thiol reductant ABC exporter subunit CydD [Kushneria aurantia]|uniref:Thiol reductant ABC exporter subunit CydD n=1 Tax=Kushneria aurantia TaxID=504092 RepID=A0ABV6G3L4_9GAMM|nr:thiol reductant ABC exporter subunit CydD [Kushneria aurantia]